MSQVENVIDFFTPNSVPVIATAVTEVTVLATGSKTVVVSGRKLAEIREKILFMNQEQLAEVLGMTARGVGRIEQSSVTTMFLRRIPRLAAAMKKAESEVVDMLAHSPEEMRISRSAESLPAIRIKLTGDVGRIIKREAKDRGVSYLEAAEQIICEVSEALKRRPFAEEQSRDTGYAATGGKPEEPPMPPKKPKRPR